MVACGQPKEYDILIKGGTVYDGSGSPARVLDLGIRDGRIADLGDLGDAKAAKIIDANGLAVSPGFIDLHTHLEAIERFPRCESLVRQGITTALGGPDGGGPWPFDDHLKVLAEKGVPINVGFLVGHNVVRRNVMGLADREPTPEELDAMKDQVATAMKAGAFGLSTGLKYLPGTFAKTDEIIELSKVAAQYGGFYTSHLRDEGLGLLPAVKEALVIGREAGIPIVLTHHKVVGKPSWGSSVRSLAMVDSARNAGQDVMLDQYPYAASHTTIGILIPSWALEGGTERFKARVADKTLRDSIRNQIVDNLINDRGGNDLRRVQLCSVSWNHELDGKTLHDWCLEEKLEPTMENGAELVIRAQSNGRTQCIFHAMDEGDIKRIMRHPFAAVATDGSVTNPEGGLVHPRSYGTFPRVFSKYVRDEKVISMEEAVRKMTALPAARLGLTDRGMLRKGFFADLVVFDEQRIGDTNSYLEPHQYPEGISCVLVNGVVTVEGNAQHDVNAGRVLYGTGKKD